jgi:hypothetical protein
MTKAAERLKGELLALPKSDRAELAAYLTATLHSDGIINSSLSGDEFEALAAATVRLTANAVGGIGCNCAHFRQ